MCSVKKQRILALKNLFIFNKVQWWILLKISLSSQNPGSTEAGSNMWHLRGWLNLLESSVIDMSDNCYHHGTLFHGSSPSLSPARNVTGFVIDFWISQCRYSYILVFHEGQQIHRFSTYRTELGDERRVAWLLCVVDQNVVGADPDKLTFLVDVTAWGSIDKIELMFAICLYKLRWSRMRWA